MKLEKSVIDEINTKLQDYYGSLPDGKAIWRIVYSETEWEYRRGTFDKFDANGNWVGAHSGVDYRPKYRQWIQDKYVLERLTRVPKGVETDLLTAESYEPVWVFEDINHKFLPPRFDVSKIVIDQIMLKAAQMAGVKYKDPYDGLTPEQAKEQKVEEIKLLEEYLYGNETSITDSLMKDEGVGYGPRNRTVS